MTTERPDLPEFLCREIHAYEWRHPISGSSHSGKTRTTPCTDCETAAALAVEWQGSDEGLRVWMRAKFVAAFPDLVLP